MPASPTSSVLIVGGGIAGLSAAVRLAAEGVPVTLLETRKKLGGRATSFADVRSGEVLDNCQHVVLGCCTNYLDLLSRLGMRDAIEWYDEQYWVEAGGRTSVIRPSMLPAPLHFSIATARASFLSRSDLACLARIGRVLLRVDRQKHRNETFGTFLSRYSQTPSVIARFWSPIVVSACNMDVDRVAASVALHVFQEGFLGSPEAARMGVPRVPLVELYEQAEKLITTAKKGDLNARRAVARDMQDTDIIKKLFDVLAPRYAARNGGYTRVLKLQNRQGDNAQLALIKLIA